MANNFFKYELSKKLKSEKAQYKWLESMYYEIMELDSIKEVSKKLTNGFKLSKNKSFYGQMTNKETYEDKKLIRIEYMVIRINIKDMAKDNKNLMFLIDTIAHEIAHFIHWEHNTEHTKLTKKFTKELIQEFKIKKATEVIEKYKNIAKNKKI